MSQGERKPMPDPELEPFFTAVRRNSELELPQGLRRSILASARRVQAESLHETVKRWEFGRWWAAFRLWSPAWQPAGVLAAFTLIGFGAGFILADNVELLAAEFMTAGSGVPETDIFSQFEQLVMEG